MAAAYPAGVGANFAQIPLSGQGVNVKFGVFEVAFGHGWLLN